MNKAVAILCVIAAILARTSVDAEPVIFESGESQTTLLELFTSEGCSSCPPADAWISKLKTSGDLWKNVVPVVWHVDYWDRLGWRDRFAQREFTARQQRYANEWRSGSVYTPGFVLNGREWRDWSEVARLPSSSSHCGQLRLQVEDKIVASFTPSSSLTAPLQLQVALLGMNLESNVARGENSGRKLHHDFVVLAVGEASMQKSGDSYSATISLPNKNLSEKPAALVGWVTSHNAQAPLQATGGWLAANNSK